nr:transposase [Dickeya dianthicola]
MRVSLNFCLSGGQAHESRYAETLLRRAGIIRKSRHLKLRPNAVLADKGYTSQPLRYHLKIKGIKAENAIADGTENATSLNAVLPG